MRLDPAKSFERVTSNTAEVVTEDELRALCQNAASGQKVKAYIGFEPSGHVHLGWKITADKVRDFVHAGFETTILLADWHAQINDKLGGDLANIRACGEYMKDCFAALGVPTGKVKFVYANDYVNDPAYWATVIAVAKNTSLARMRRAMDIMGRSAEDAERDVSKFLYPAMQVADIFHMDIDVAYGGLDQRHAHMLQRDVAAKLNRKPAVAIHTPLLAGLKAQGRMDPVEAKMSKRDPSSSILIHDSAKEVEEKLNAAFCPQGQAEGNPVVQIAQFVLFPNLSREGNARFEIDRPAKFGGPLTFASYAELEQAFAASKVHPLDLKKAVAKELNLVLQPSRDYFVQHPKNRARLDEIRAST
jgi:tyrosyl-tRNA synthetase